MKAKYTLTLAAALMIAPVWLGAQAQEQAEAAKMEGDRLTQAQDYAAAVAAYDRAIQLQPDFKAAYKGRGIAHRWLHQTELEVLDYGKVIELDAQDAEAYFERGGAYLALHHVDLAIQDFDKAIQLKPDYGRAYSARGGAKSKSGDAEGAQADWAKADSLGNSIKRIRVGGNVQQAKLIRQPVPDYPKKAKRARVSGVVLLNAIIGKDGTIQNLSLVSGHPLLAPAAMDAVKQWVYAPTLVDGRPVEVVTQIQVNFTVSP